MQIIEQLSLSDISEGYKAFVDKFKPKKTTDDCYTPENVYETILEWAMTEYGFSREQVVRPFWPGGDYIRFDYPPDCVVVDNPPFSIVSQICANYIRFGIRFFLFAPYITNFSSQARGVCHIITDSEIMYENGAKVNTSFLTNLDEYEMRTAPDLNKAIKTADAINRKEQVKELPKYSYPPEVITATMLGYIGKYGIDFRVRPESCRFIRALESQKQVGKTIFGSGYLLSRKAAAEKAAAEKAAAEKAAAEKAAAEKAAAEKAAATRWKLSESELAAIDDLI